MLKCVNNIIPKLRNKLFDISIRKHYQLYNFNKIYYSFNLMDNKEGKIFFIS